jgi:hypothetical protein
MAIKQFSFIHSPKNCESSGNSQRFAFFVDGELAEENKFLSL